MILLSNQQCVACRSDSIPLTAKEIADLHPQVPDWSLESVYPGGKLTRVYLFSNFAEALAFTNGIGSLAETSDHHPKIITEWGRVSVSWWTHKIRALHRNDFIMAARVDQLFQKLQPKG